MSARLAPFSTSGLAKLIERVGIEAKMPFKVHPHMLRHSTGGMAAAMSAAIPTLSGWRRIRSSRAKHCGYLARKISSVSIMAV
jgi:integrase